MQLMDIQQITKGIANSYFQQWFASKIGANTKEDSNSETKIIN